MRRYMSPGLLRTQLDEGWEILRLVGLDKEYNRYPSYPVNAAAKFRNFTYTDAWKYCVSNLHYDFLLSDNSFFQFRVISFKPFRGSFSFYECPFLGIPYHEFLASELGATPEEAGDIFRDDYETFLLSLPTKETVTPIRYDYDPDRYREGIHPASHVHFGHSSNIRVGTSRVLNPLSFVLFILRQCYKDAWAKLLGEKKISLWCRNVRDNLAEIDPIYIKQADKWEMILY